MSSEAGKIPDYAKALYLSVLFGLSCFLPFFLFMTLVRHDWNLFPALLENDFQNVWVGARQAVKGDISVLFDFKAYQKELPIPEQFYVWSYPLHLLLMIFPLGWLPYPLAFAVWTTAGLAFFLYTCGKILPQEERKHGLILLALAPATIINLQVGQNGLFTAALLIGGLYFIKNRRQGLAGLSFGILTIKPHLGILIPFLLLSLKKWRAIIVASLVCISLFLCTLAFWNIQSWAAYVDSVNHVSVSNLLNIGKEPYTLMLASNYASLRSTGLPSEVSFGFHVISAVIVGWAAFKKLHRNGMTDKNIFLIVFATAIILPYLFNYDLTALSAMIVICMAKLNAQKQDNYTAKRPFIIPGLVFMLPMTTYIFKMLHLPLTGVILLIGFYWAYYRLPETEAAETTQGYAKELHA